MTSSMAVSVESAPSATANSHIAQNQSPPIRSSPPKSIASTASRQIRGGGGAAPTFERRRRHPSRRRIQEPAEQAAKNPKPAIHSSRLDNHPCCKTQRPVRMTAANIKMGRTNSRPIVLSEPWASNSCRRSGVTPGALSTAPFGPNSGVKFFSAIFPTRLRKVRLKANSNWMTKPSQIPRLRDPGLELTIRYAREEPSHIAEPATFAAARTRRATPAPTP